MFERKDLKKSRNFFGGINYCSTFAMSNKNKKESMMNNVLHIINLVVVLHIIM